MSVFVMCAATVLFFSDMDTRMKAEPKSAAEFYAVYKRYNLWLPPKDAKRSRNSLPSGQRTPADARGGNLRCLRLATGTPS